MFLLLCVMLAMIPFSKGPFEYEIGFFTLHSYPAVVLLVFPLSVWRVIQRPSSYGFRSIELALILLTLSFLQSTLLSSTLLTSGRLAFHALFIPILSFFISKALIVTDREYKIAINILVLSIFMFSIVTILTYIDTGIRPIVFSIQPIGVATIALVGFYFSISSKNIFNIFKYISTLTISGALILSMSRVYLLYVIVSPLLIKIIKKYIVLLWGLMIIVSLVLTLVVTYSIDNYSYAHASAEGANTMERMYEIKHLLRAIAGRAYVYKNSLEDFWSSTIFGVGIHVGEYQVTPHNFHVEWLQYGGVIGYLLYVSVFLLHAKNVSRYIKNDTHLLANELILLGIMINSITNGFMHGVIPYMAFLVMGISEARINILKKNK